MVVDNIPTSFRMTLEQQNGGNPTTSSTSNQQLPAEMRGFEERLHRYRQPSSPITKPSSSSRTMICPKLSPERSNMTSIPSSNEHPNMGNMGCNAYQSNMSRFLSHFTEYFNYEHANPMEPSHRVAGDGTVHRTAVVKEEVAKPV